MFTGFFKIWHRPTLPSVFQPDITPDSYRGGSGGLIRLMADHNKKAVKQENP